MRRWNLFEHPIKAPRREDGSSVPGFRGAHVTDASTPHIPACGTIAVFRSLGGEPLGFVPACCMCLAISEVP